MNISTLSEWLEFLNLFKIKNEEVITSPISGLNRKHSFEIILPVSLIPPVM